MPLTLIRPLEPRVTYPPEHDEDWWDHPFIVEAYARRNVGLFLRAWREAHWPERISQARTARWLAMTQATLSLIETGLRRVSEDERVRWLEILHVPASMIREWVQP